MRTPLSWLRDFAPIEGEPEDLVATLDDLGLVVEGFERVGEGLDDVVVARVESIAPIEGADKIRLVTVDAGGSSEEIVCGAWNFGVGDLVPLAKVGTQLPNGLTISRRKMRGVTSNGMLCSGDELRLSSDHDGLLVLTDVEGARPGMALTEALEIEPDVVFDLTVEGNRPDAWSMAGVARDLAARLGLPFTLPEPSGWAVGPEKIGDLSSLVVEDLDLCPRITTRLLLDVAIGPSPRWMARRLTLAGMRPINNVVDASNYVMLELGQPTHPYDLERLVGRGLLVRRARPGEHLTTLDGVERALGTRGRGLGDTGEDCLICDAESRPVGVGGIMGGASSEIGESTTTVLLESAYFAPMAIARTSKRLGLRTEASARFERGCDPWGIDRAAERFVQLVGSGRLAEGVLDVRGEVPEPFKLFVSSDRIAGVLGVPIDPPGVAALIGPIGFACRPEPDGTAVTVPTDRPDVRPDPFGIDDVIEEVARMYGYVRLPRRTPSWPEPGSLTAAQRGRRLVKDICCGLGATEVWTPSLMAPSEHELIGLGGHEVVVANPLTADESVLRRSLLPGLLRALAYNADRRSPDIRLFEVGVVFTHPLDGSPRFARAGSGGSGLSELPSERELLAAVFALPDDDARTAVAAWQVLAETLRLAEVSLDQRGELPAGLHPTRSGRVLVAGGIEIGAVGEVDPDVAEAFGLGGRRIGWLSVDLGRLLDPEQVPRRPEGARSVSRFPSSDIDLAFSVPEEVPAARLADALAEAGGELLESVTLFDIYRGPGMDEGRRSLAFRLRFVSSERTLTDAEVGERRQAAIDAVADLGALLR